MNSKIISNGILRAVAIITGIFLLLYLLNEIRPVIWYVALAAVVSLIGRPLVLFLRRRLKFKNTLAVIVTIILLIGVVIGLISLFVPLIVAQGQNLSLLDIEELKENLETLYVEILDYFSLRNIDLQESIKSSGIFANLDFGIIPNLLNTVIGTLGSFSIGLFSVLFISFFFLKDSHLFEDALMVFVTDSKEWRWRKSISKIKDLLSRYFLGLVFQISVLFVIYTVVLMLAGIDNAIVIAFLCALLNLIPYVGPLIGGVLMITLSMTSNLGQDFSSFILPKTLWVLGGFVFGQLIDNFVSQPLIFSSSVKSHPLEIFLVIIIAGLLFGVVGMIVAIPAYTAIKVILKEFLADNKIVQSLTRDL